MPSASGDTCLVQSCSSSMTYLYSTRAWGWEGGSRREKEKSERKKKKRKTPKKKLEEENSEIFMKKWKNDNAPREASRALQSTRPQGTTPSARARSRGRTSQKGSATRRCRAFGGCIESVGEFFFVRGQANENGREKKKRKKKGKKRRRRRTEGVVPVGLRSIEVQKQRSRPSVPSSPVDAVLDAQPHAHGAPSGPGGHGRARGDDGVARGAEAHRRARERRRRRQGAGDEGLSPLRVGGRRRAAAPGNARRCCAAECTRGGSCGSSSGRARRGESMRSRSQRRR